VVFVAGARIRRTGRLGNVGYVGYYWTRSVVPTNRWYRYARYLGFGDYNVHAEFANAATGNFSTELKALMSA
jgi:hypothetical protein